MSFWVRNIAIALWIVVMAVALRRAMERDRDRGRGPGVSIVSNLRTDPKRELWFAWYSTVAFYSLYSVVFFVLTRTQPPGKPYLEPRADRRVVRRPPLGPARRVRADLRPRRLVGDGHRADHLLDPTDVGEPSVRLLLPRPLPHRRHTRLPVHLHRHDRRRDASRSQPRCNSSGSTTSASSPSPARWACSSSGR